MKVQGVWLSSGQAPVALGWSRKRWTSHAASYPARDNGSWAEYFVPLDHMPPSSADLWRKRAEEYDWPETPRQVVDGSEIDINEILKTGDMSFDIGEQLKRTQKQKLEKEIAWIQQKLEIRRAQLFAQWTAVFSQQIFKAFAGLKNCLADMRLTEAQTEAFKSALEDSLASLDQRLAELKERGYKKEEDLELQEG